MRMHDVVPFTVDFTGALYVQINSVEGKVYICLFTCATTQGVHLKIVTDLTTDTFLLALSELKVFTTELSQVIPLVTSQQQWS